MIRLATKDDLQEVSKLWIDMVKELRSDWEPDAEFWIDQCKTLIDTQTYFIIIVEYDEKIVGFLDGISYFDPSEGKTIGLARNFYLKADYRNKGVATKMWTEMSILARVHGVEVIELQCFSNMVEYWESFGFETKQYILRMVI